MVDESENKDDIDEYFQTEKESKLDQFFTADLSATPAEDVLRELESFVEGHSKGLQALRDSFTYNISNLLHFTEDTVELQLAPYENTPNVCFLTQDRTDNHLFNKVANVFSVLCYEVMMLRTHADSKILQPIAMFMFPEAEDDEEGGDGGAEGGWASLEIEMASFIPFLQDASNFVNRVNAVVRNFVEQLAHLYHQKHKLYISTFKYVEFNAVWTKLGEALSILIELDTIIKDNGDLAHAWEIYKKMLGYVKNAPEKFDVEKSNLRDFQHQIINLENTIMAGNSFTNCMSQAFGSPVSPHGSSLKAKKQQQNLTSKIVTGNRALFQEMDRYIKYEVKMLVAELRTNEIQHRRRLIGLFSMYVLQRKLFDKTTSFDKKLFKQLWALQNDICMVHLRHFGEAVWYPAEFLAEHITYPGRSIDMSIKATEGNRRDILNKMDAEFNTIVDQYYIKVCAWMIKFDEESVYNVKRTSEISAHLRIQTKRLISGLLLARRIKNYLNTMVFLHLKLEASFKKAAVRNMAVCAELLKSMQLAFHRQSKRISENMSYMLVLIQRTLQKIFLPLKQKLEKSARLTGVQIDALGALTLCMDLLNGVPTDSRRAALNMACSVAALKQNVMKKDDVDEVRYQLWKLDMMTTWQRQLREACDCSFLYFVSDLQPIVIQDIFNNPDQAYRMPYWAHVVGDAYMLFESVEHKGGQAPLEEYKTSLKRYVNEGLVTPLCRAMENDLRLHIHSVVLNQEGLMQNTENKALSRFVQLKPFRFMGTVVDIKKRVEHYLDTTFYNMATTALSDWRIYSEMRNLAYKKYGLELIEVHLPSHSHYSEGLDVLEIMRNIHVFVQKYNYNLNTQIFIERSFDQLHLNSINITHIANSIRTHGTGIMNTTVNFTYQFLCKKFLIFSEFLYDDHIKSRLMKDLRFFKENRVDLNNQYPYARAQKFNRGIRTLGMDDQGHTYLDHFRRLITEIGNALGYVRMIRSGGLYHASKAIEFVPEVDDIPEFHELINSEGLSEGSIKSSKNLDNVLGDLSSSFAEGTEFFHVLCGVFQNILRAADYAHLKQFVAILPPMTLNFVEKMLVQKDRINKKGGRSEASFTDDGFALGIAFILELLDLNTSFDAFHWWKEVSTNIKQQEKELQRQKTSSARSTDDAETWTLSMKRLRSLKREWQLLNFSFQASRIFFRRDLEDDEPEEATPAEGDNTAPPAPEEAAPPPAAPAYQSYAEAAPPAPAPEQPMMVGGGGFADDDDPFPDDEEQPIAALPPAY